jgi:FixJ family two-component response regulator
VQDEHVAVTGLFPQHILVAKGLAQEIDRSCFHGLHAHRDIAVTGHENARDVNIGLRQLGLKVRHAMKKMGARSLADLVECRSPGRSTHARRTDANVGMIPRGCLVHQISPVGFVPMQTRSFFACKGSAIMPQVPVIAIIEDDASVRVATQNFVRSLGFTACAFEAAEEFMRSPHMTEASCLIADVQLPGMSGVELQTVLCAQGRDTPIIFLSAFQDEAIRASAIKAGAVCFLSKPVDGQILVECLDRALNKRQ